MQMANPAVIDNVAPTTPPGDCEEKGTLSGSSFMGLSSIGREMPAFDRPRILGPRPLDSLKILGEPAALS